ETEDKIASGMSPRAARHAALRRFGSVTLAREEARAVWIPVWLDQLRQDLRYGFRMLRRNPGLTMVAVLTLGLGIGLTTAVFSVVHAVLIRPLPYADAERIVFVRETFREQLGNASPGHFHDWSEHATVFEYTAAGQGTTFNLAGEGDPERLRGMRVTPGYFDVARIPPAVGRYFTQQDVEHDSRIVVLSHSLWLARFGGDRSIVGRQLRLGGEPFTVVGVAPAAYALTDPSRAAVTGGFSAQLWTPLTFTPELRNNFGNHSFGVLAKLKPGVTRRQAQADLEHVTAGIAERHPIQMESRGVAVVPLFDEWSATSRRYCSFSPARRDSSC
ncbi:MAG TPA: ABC transporter permease, partial [Vicinamibacterales bacterium]|nr:ABC transporter permease [Vicinamibacterales bacterium]